MKIAYISIYDSNDIHSWSGSAYYIAQSLIKQGFEIERICPLKIKNKFLFKLYKAFQVYILKKNYHIDREPLVVKYFAKQAQKEIERIKPDLILSPGTLAIADLDTNIPIIIWADATYEGLADYYVEFKNLNHKKNENAEIIEKKALDKCKLGIFTSDWAAKSAVEYYNIDKNKIKVLPFGANVIHSNTENDIKEFNKNKSDEIIKLLFIGVHWQRKGGDIAFKVADKINKLGYKCEIDIVGCTPPETLPDFVKVHGFISKSRLEGQNKIERLYKEAHFLIVPTRAECFGLVFAEANSYGVPAICTNTGGIPSVVIDNVNGKKFELDADIDDYVNYIINIFKNKEDYNKLSESSFDEFIKRLNWDYASSEFKKLVDNI